MSVLAECRVVRHGAIEGQPAEPAMGQGEADLLAWLALGRDAAQAADQRYADQELGRNGGATAAAVTRRERVAPLAHVEQPVDSAHRVISRNHRA